MDRSASYMARYIAKNLVAAGLADRIEIQLAYAIGVAEPVSVMLDSFGTAKVDDSRIVELIRKHFQLTPKGIIESLDLRRPVYLRTAAYGHFGREEDGFTWEKTDKGRPAQRRSGNCSRSRPARQLEKGGQSRLSLFFIADIIRLCTTGARA